LLFHGVGIAKPLGETLLGLCHRCLQWGCLFHSNATPRRYLRSDDANHPCWPSDCRTDKADKRRNRWIFNGFLLVLIAVGDLLMNIRSTRPDRSPEAVARRRKATDQARAANVRQGYTNDPRLDAANERYVAGEITLDEFRSEMLARFHRA
jgi:hypothetical protein